MANRLSRRKFWEARRAGGDLGKRARSAGFNASSLSCLRYCCLRLDMLVMPRLQAAHPVRRGHALEKPLVRFSGGVEDLSIKTAP